MGEAHPVGLRAGTALTAGLCGLQQGEAVTCQAHPRGGSILSFQALWETQYNLLPPEGGSECPLKDGCSAAQSCPSLGDPTDCSLQSSSVHGTLQKRILEWIAIPSSRGNLPNPGIESRSPALQANSLPSMLLLLLSRFSRVRLCATPERAAHQAPPSLGFSRQEHWSGLPFPSPMHESEM